jgi:glutamate-1-semialdehyde 2,1-aminomutase
VHHNLRSASQKVLARMSRLAPAGVNSPVRAWQAVGGDPPVLERGAGAHVWDLDGNRYVDLVCAWGPLIAGHAPANVVHAVREAANRGTGFGAPTSAEMDLAELIVASFPSIEKVRLVTSGTEATMTAIRIARAATSRNRIVKFSGCYHGHSDGLLVRAGSGAATFGIPDSAGVPEAISQLTTVVDYNDIDRVRHALAEGPPVAAVILEPIAANMGVVPPVAGFLADLIEASHAAGALVIFDEVITGFRVARGGAQELYGVAADLTCLGKIIGGGLPVAAVGGKADLLDLLSPLGPVYQAGTLAGNPVACAAGAETIKLLTADAYSRLETHAALLERGLLDCLAESGIAGTVQRVGSLLTLFFGPDTVRNFHDAAASDTARFARFFRAMIDRRIYLPPSQFEAWFVSLAHGTAEIDGIVSAAREALLSCAAE